MLRGEKETGRGRVMYGGGREARGEALFSLRTNKDTPQRRTFKLGGGVPRVLVTSLPIGRLA